VLRNGGSDAKDRARRARVARRSGRPRERGRHARRLLSDSSAKTQPLLASAVLGGGRCNGKPCWKGLASGDRYKNRSAAPDGLTDEKLRVSGAGESLVVKGQGANLALPSLDLTPPVRLQLVVSDPAGSTCWESHFPSAQKSDAGTFRASGG